MSVEALGYLVSTFSCFAFFMAMSDNLNRARYLSSQKASLHTSVLFVRSCLVHQHGLEHQSNK